MIAPDPAATGPRPAAAARPEPARVADPHSRTGRGGRACGDFDSVLSGRAARRQPGESEPRETEAATEAGPAPAPADMPVTLFVPVPAETAPPPQAAGALAAAAGSQAVEALPAAAAAESHVPEAAVAPPAQPDDAPGVAASPERPGDTAALLPDDDRAAPRQVLTPGAATPPVPVPPRAASQEATRVGNAARREAAAIGRDVETPAPHADAPAPRRGSAAGSTQGSTQGAAPQPQAAGGDRATPGVVLQDAAPAPWHLSAEPAGVQARHEAAPALPQTQTIQPQAVVGQVAVAISKASDRRVEIRLDPPELGRVQIHLAPLDGGVQAVVLADRPETQHLLRRHAEDLVRELGAAGYDTVSLDFAAGGEAAPGRDETRARDWAETVAIAGPVEAVTQIVAAPRRSLTGGLDVRL